MSENEESSGEDSKSVTSHFNNDRKHEYHISTGADLPRKRVDEASLICLISHIYIYIYIYMCVCVCVCVRMYRRIRFCMLKFNYVFISLWRYGF